MLPFPQETKNAVFCEGETRAAVNRALFAPEKKLSSHALTLPNLQRWLRTNVFWNTIAKINVFIASCAFEFYWRVSRFFGAAESGYVNHVDKHIADVSDPRFIERGQKPDSRFVAFEFQTLI